MAKSYPNIGEIIPHTTNKMCALCRNRKDHKDRSCNKRIDVQINYFRGDDEVVYAHQSCIKGIRNNELLELILKYWEDKRNATT